jgi:hypothetical protein
MALASYADLKAAVASWVDREDSDFAARVPDFIALCEQRLNYGGADGAGLRVAEMEKTAALTADANGKLILPADYLEFRSMQPGTPGYDALALGGIDATSGFVPTGGVPARTSITGNVVSTYPRANAPVTVTYYAKIPALSDSNPTNWLLTKAPGVYLYGSLLESAPFESDDARMQSWLALYQSAIAGLKATDAGARFANATVRVRSCTP